ncbi:MAG TPA: site-specific integrase [Thermodesulfobacteriota bacterium]
MPGFIAKKNGRYYPVVDLGREGGKRRLKWHEGHATKEAAKTELRKLLGALDQGAYVEPARRTVGEWLTTWLEQYATPAVTPKTLERYRQIVDLHLRPRLGDVKLGKLTPLQVDAAYAALREKKLSETTIRQVHAVLHRALRVAVKKGLLGRNVADAVETPKPARHTVQPLDEAKTIALVEATAGTPLGMPVLLAVMTGCRRGELLALRWRDVDLDAGRLTVRQSLEQTKAGLRFKPPKSGKPRAVALPAAAVAALKKHRAKQAETLLQLGKRLGDDDLVLAQVDGTPWPPDRLTRAFRDFLIRAKLPRMRFHDARHGHASHLLRQGVPLKVVSERLGHSTIGITADLYTHVLEGMDREAADKLDAALKGATKGASGNG